MSRTPLVDRFHFLATPDQGSNTPVLASVPTVTSGDDGVAVMRIYDPIDDWGGPWGLSAKEFVQALDELPEDTTEVHLHINSPGGMVWEGLAILNALRQHKARVVAIVDGIAASAASFIAMGADEVVMAPNSELMIHNPWGLAIGDHAVMEKMAKDLLHETRNLADIYRRKAGGDLDTWLAAMADETWYSAEEAVEASLADRLLEDAPDDQSSLKARYDLTVFHHAGRRDAPGPRTPARPAALAALARAGSRPPAEPEDTTNPDKKGASAMPEELIKGLRNRLGIPADAELDDDGLLAAIDEALAEQADPTAGQTITPPEGTVLVDAEQFAALKAGAEAGAKAREEQLEDARKATVDAAVREGRIPKARTEHWLAQLEADPEGARAVLASLAPGTIPLEPKGYTGGVSESSDTDDTIYALAWGDDEKGA